MLRVFYALLLFVSFITLFDEVFVEEAPRTLVYACNWMEQRTRLQHPLISCLFIKFERKNTNELDWQHIIVPSLISLTVAVRFLAKQKTTSDYANFMHKCCERARAHIHCSPRSAVLANTKNKLLFTESRDRDRRGLGREWKCP